MEPIVPACVDLRGLPYMPLDVNRLRDSQLAIAASGDEFRAAVLLWCASWNQVPAASLPADDATLAAYAGYGRDVKGWKKVKLGSMRGFVLCDDGRWYHPVVAEKAMEAWEERQEYRAGIENEKDRKKRERTFRSHAFAALRAVGITLPWDTKTGRLRDLLDHHGVTVSLPVTGTHGVTGHIDGHEPVTVTGHTPDTAKKGREGKEEQEHRSPDGERFARAPDEEPGDADPVLPPPEAPPEASRLLEPTETGTAAKALRAAGVPDAAPHRPELRAALAEGIPVAEMADTARELAVVKPHPKLAYVLATVRGRRADAGRSTTEKPHASKTHPGRESASDRVARINREAEARERIGSGRIIEGGLGHAA